LRLDLSGPDTRLTNVHHVDERGAWASRGRRILHAEDGESCWREIGRFPGTRRTEIFAASRWASRALRLARCTVYPTCTGAVLAIRDGVAYRLASGGMQPLFRVEGRCVMNRAIAETPAGELYFGEYHMNPRREPVRIWRVSSELDRWEVAHVFDEPRIRHVHAVHVDPYRSDRLWITMGDFDGECFLAYTDDGFAKVSILGDGTQLWRMVGIAFREDRLCWLTDTEVAPNRIVSMERGSGDVTVHGSRPGSSWYVAETTDGVYLATTTVEPGPAVDTRLSHLLASLDGVTWQEVATFRKDCLPMPWFAFGSISLPSGRFSSRRFWISGEGLRGLDGASRLCALRPDRARASA